MSLTSIFQRRQSFSTSRSHVYSYIHVQSTNSERPTLLLLHGFPSHASDWIYQIEHFSSLGYGILAPDLLGYGQTSKPRNADAYRLKRMSNDLIELLDYVNLEKVIGIGHDFGSTLLSRFAAYYPEHLSACVFLAVGPPRLGTPFNVDAINSMTKEQLGYEMLGYVPFISRGPDSESIMEKNAKCVMSLLFCADEKREWRHHFRPLGAFEKFVVEDKCVDIGKWFSPGLQEAHLDAFAKAGGFAGAQG